MNKINQCSSSRGCGCKTVATAKQYISVRVRDRIRKACYFHAIPASQALFRRRRSSPYKCKRSGKLSESAMCQVQAYTRFPVGTVPHAETRAAHISLIWSAMVWARVVPQGMEVSDSSPFANRRHRRVAVFHRTERVDAEFSRPASR
jgi:hypothetical protein